VTFNDVSGKEVSGLEVSGLDDHCCATTMPGVSKNFTATRNSALNTSAAPRRGGRPRSCFGGSGSEVLIEMSEKEVSGKEGVRI
jgi:hypothetical protein